MKYPVLVLALAAPIICILLLSLFFDYVNWEEGRAAPTMGDEIIIMSNDTNDYNRRRAIFIPFPHNTLGSGVDMECRWETKALREGDAAKYDSTQRAAFAEGVCVPPRLNSSLRVFSSAEARECLRFRRVIISGDSYMKQLFVGLADILLSTKLSRDYQMVGSSNRSKVVASANHYLTERRRRDNTVAVVGAGVHIEGAALGEIKKFLNLTKRTIFVPMPAGLNRSREVYEGLLPYLAPNHPEHPFLDVFQLTRSCTMQNCSYDGSHRSRYVNRWKAQLLLNTLCEILG
ncbi:hypothetical protein ACHAW5_009091 [Stephanodiscus triporus]|uniref:Uncharacterized protein n=1 Tax=Stephanodiscus triporus TaxID=2934178 RepID=A0ABD3QKD8_9STRA